MTSIISTKRPTILILTGNHWQFPVIETARRMGLRIVVTDRDRQAPGLARADEREVVDVLDLEAVLQVAKKHRVDGVIAEQTDVAVLTAAYVAEAMHLPGIGIETALTVTDKWRMRKACKAAGLASPECHMVRNLDEALGTAQEIGMPIVCKPIDGQASRGVSKVTNPEDVASCYEKARRASRSERVLVEQLLLGTDTSAETIVNQGEIHLLGISERHKCPPPTAYDVRILYPSRFDQDVESQIREYNDNVIRACNIPFGLTHAEYVVTKDGVRLVEIAARGGGSGIATRVLPAISGVDVIECRIRQALGETVSIAYSPPWKHAIVEFLVLPAGRVTRIGDVAAARRVAGVLDLTLSVSLGDVVAEAQDCCGRAGHIITVGNSREEALAVVANVKATLDIQMEVENVANAA